MIGFKTGLFLLSFVFVVAFGGYNKGGGSSNSFRKQDDQGNYAFGYDIKDPYGATNSRKESGDAWGNKEGSYSLADTDGRQRYVEYWADKKGFRAKIKSNEPGVITSEAADASYNADDGGKGYGSGSGAGSGGSYTYQNGGPGTGKW